jgi:hypothetical protein
MMGMPTLSRKDIFRSIKPIASTYAAQFIFIAVLGIVWFLSDVNLFFYLGYYNIDDYSMIEAVKTAAQGGFDAIVFWPVFFAYRRFYANSKFRQRYACIV